MLTSIVACQVARSPASPETLTAAIDQMQPHYECILYYDQTNNPNGVTRAIDQAVTIGESYGLSPSEIMGIYTEVRKTQEQKVLQKALEFSDKRENALPRISGAPLQPNLAEERRAWVSLYAKGCGD